MAKDNWISGAVKNKGALHKSLGVPEGESVEEDPCGGITPGELPRLGAVGRAIDARLSSFSGPGAGDNGGETGARQITASARAAPLVCLARAAIVR